MQKEGNMKVIEHDNMALRCVHDDDHPWLVALHNDPTVLHNMTHPQPITMDDHMRWWKSIVDTTSQIRMIFTVNNEPVGFAKFYDVDLRNSSCLLGADIHKTFRGQGLAKPMWTLMIRYCFESLLLHRIALTVAEYNLIGLHVYEGLGFTREGHMIQSLSRDGHYFDQICMYMLQSDWYGTTR